jgi:internalin A
LPQILPSTSESGFKHQPLNLFSASGRYTWGDDSPEDARRRGKVVERRRERLEGEGWNSIRDKNAMRSGDLISGFMKRIGQADRVIVVLSDKYLRSPYCMTELHTIYRRSNEEKEEFLRRIIPLLLGDARIGKWDMLSS